VRIEHHHGTLSKKLPGVLHWQGKGSSQPCWQRHRAV